MAALAIGAGAGTASFVALVAQEPVVAELTGTVLLAGEALPGVEVTLHRVGADTAGALESRSTDSLGEFRFQLPRVPNPAAHDEVYFASVEYHGIQYFGPPVVTVADLDSIYRVTVYDTALVRSEISPVAVQTRTLVLEPSDGAWSVTDLFELRNDGASTLVAPLGDPVWSHPMPERASGFELGESDIAPDAVTWTGGTVRTTAPIPPGVRLYLFRYQVPQEEDLRIPQTGSERFELLVREPAPAVAVDGLSAEAPVTPEGGVTYRRFAGLNVAPSTILVRESETQTGVPLRGIAVALALLLALAALWGVRRGGETAEDRRARVVLRIARLDEAFEARTSPSDEEERRYKKERTRLAEQLRRLSV